MNSACLSTKRSMSQGQATRSTRGCSRVIHFILCSSLARGLHGQVIEAGHRIGLRPETDAPGLVRRVGRLDHERAVDEPAQRLARRLYLEVLPLARLDLRRAVLDVAARSRGVLVEVHVPLEGVRT